MSTSTAPAITHPTRDALLLVAVLAMALLAIAAGLALVPPATSFVAKPAATLLLIAWAWPRGADLPRMRLRVLAGLVLSLVGDVALLWPQQGFLPGLVAFLLAHLAYIAAFTVPVRLFARPLVLAAYALLAAAILATLWSGVPAGLRLPVLGYVVALASMAAQAAIWWRSAGTGEQAPLARRAAIGGLLFLVSDSLLAFNKFAAPLPLAPLWILASYWLAQAAIGGALSPQRR